MKQLLLNSLLTLFYSSLLYPVFSVRSVPPKNTSEGSPEKRTYQEVSNVIILNKHNFHQFLEDHEYCMILFYATWDFDTKKVLSPFEEAALHLKDVDPPVPLARLDISYYHGIAAEMGFKEPPVIRWFHRKE